VSFPEVHDGHDRLGMVYEARGDNKQAAQYYRQALEFICHRPDQYDDSGLEAASGSSPSSTRQPHEVIDHAP
jgi:hypothetical protein